MYEDLVCYLYAGELANGNGGSEFIWERDSEARSRLWKARHEVFYAQQALHPGKRVSSYLVYV